MSPILKRKKKRCDVLRVFFFFLSLIYYNYDYIFEQSFVCLSPFPLQSLYTGGSPEDMLCANAKTTLCLVEGGLDDIFNIHNSELMV